MFWVPDWILSSLFESALKIWFKWLPLWTLFRPFVKSLIKWPDDVTVVKSTLLWLQKCTFHRKLFYGLKNGLTWLNFFESWVESLVYSETEKITEKFQKLVEISNQKHQLWEQVLSLEGLSHLLEVLVSGPDTLLEGRFERKNQLSLLDSVV